MTDTDLEQVAARAAAGDSEAFETICRTLQDDIWRYCQALTGDRELALEAAQDTFMRAVTGIRRFRGDAPVRLWLLVIARRATADVIGREQRRRERRSPDELPEIAVADGSGAVDLERLVAGLPPDLAQAFVLTQVTGLTYEQAADVAGCRIGTVRSRVHRARQRLVEALTDDPLPTTSEDPQGRHRDG